MAKDLFCDLILLFTILLNKVYWIITQKNAIKINFRILKEFVWFTAKNFDFHFKFHLKHITDINALQKNLHLIRRLEPTQMKKVFKLFRPKMLFLKSCNTFKRTFPTIFLKNLFKEKKKMLPIYRLKNTWLFETSYPFMIDFLQV